MDLRCDYLNCENCLFNDIHALNLSVEEKVNLNQNKTEVIFRQGENIVKQGVFTSDVYFVKEGIIKLYIENANGKDLILKLVEPGNYIGLPTVDPGQYYGFSAQAVKNSIVCVIRNEALNNIADSNHNFCRHINGWLINDYQYLYHKISSIAIKQMNGRLAETLLYLAEEKFSKENIYEYITRRDIADLSGMSLESMNKLLNEFRLKSLIESDGKAIKIKDRDTLMKIGKYG